MASQGDLPSLALGLEGEVDHHDGVLLHDADEQDDADEGDDGQLGAGRPSGRGAPRRRPRAGSKGW